MIINQPFLGAVNTGRSAGGLKTIRTTATAPILSLAARLRGVLRPNIITAATPKYGCLMAMLPSLETVIPNWAADNIPEDTLAADGIETETHCTVLYGFNLDFDTSKLRAMIGGSGSFALKIGKLSRFECPEYDVIKFTVHSPMIVAMNRKLARKFRDSIKPSEYSYNAHVTVAYVKKGTNLNLDASAIEGQTVIVQQLLYSLPEKQGRTVIDLTPRSAGTTHQTTGETHVDHPHATLAARIRNIVKAAAHPSVTGIPVTDQSTDHHHDVIRRAAAARYQAAVDEFTAHAKSDALAAKKRKRTELAALFLLLMSDAGEEAYTLTYPRLDALVPERGMGSVLPPDQIKAEAEAFATKRAEFLRDFPNTVADRLAAAKEQAEADTDDEKAVRQAVNKAAEAVKDGIGTRVADTEAQATYGAAQVEVLRRAGYTTALWDQIDRPSKRDTHALNMEMGPMPLGTLYPNGQRYPGDPAGGPGECVNCLCVLTGYDRVKPTTALDWNKPGVPVQATAHDVSDEKRDAGGKWTTGGVNFEQSKMASGRKDEVIHSDVAKIEKAWSADKSMHIGSGGSIGTIGKRYDNAKKFIADGSTVIMPEAAANARGEITFIDGRHRFAALRDAGHKTVPISVPKEDAEHFRKAFAT